jgi:ribokinase
MLVACLGDVMLDVIVDVPAGLVPDDDTHATITFTAGGQAANVAAWVAELGGEARVFGPRSASGNGRLVDEALAAAGVTVHGPLTDHPGTVLSLVTTGSRSLASDPGSTDWLGEIAPGPWLAGADWLFLSGYALLRAPHPQQLIDLGDAARAAGTRVAVDLASGSMIQQYGAASFRALWHALRPEVIFANDQEWAATHEGRTEDVGPSFGAGGTSVLVLKQGAEGCTFVIDGIGDHRSPVPGPVRDVTGAGDALAAGFLLGGTDLAMEVAARCVAQLGAQPRPGRRRSRTS